MDRVVHFPKSHVVHEREFLAVSSRMAGIQMQQARCATVVVRAAVEVITLIRFRWPPWSRLPVKPNFCCALLCLAIGLLAQQRSTQEWQMSFAAAPQQDAKLQVSPFKLDCMHLDYIKKGRPVFVGSDDSVRIGISTQKDIVAPSDPIIVDLWIDNRNGQADYVRREVRATAFRGRFRRVGSPTD
jgi:hypothetical protein